jgi:hypothetical protein
MHEIKRIIAMFLSYLTGKFKNAVAVNAAVQAYALAVTPRDNSSLMGEVILAR